MRKAALCFAVGLLAVVISACGGRASEDVAPERVFAAIAATEGAIGEPVKILDPQSAVAALYETLGNGNTERVDQDRLYEVFGLDPDIIVSAVAYVSDVTGGLRDVAIVEPAPGKADQVREALNQYRMTRAASFRNYDILNSYSIATNAAVFYQGDYVVMLMFPDNDAARVILDQYIPN